MCEEMERTALLVPLFYDTVLSDYVRQRRVMAYGGRLVVNDESGCVCEEVVVAILKHYTEMSK